jgi:hypothetical protein
MRGDRGRLPPMLVERALRCHRQSAFDDLAGGNE